MEGGETENVNALGGQGRRPARGSVRGALAWLGEVPVKRGFGENIKLVCSLRLLADLSKRRFSEDVRAFRRPDGRGPAQERNRAENVHGACGRGSAGVRGDDQIFVRAPPGGSSWGCFRGCRFLGVALGSAGVTVRVRTVLVFVLLSLLFRVHQQGSLSDVLRLGVLAVLAVQALFLLWLLVLAALRRRRIGLEVAVGLLTRPAVALPVWFGLLDVNLWLHICGGGEFFLGLLRF